MTVSLSSVSLKSHSPRRRRLLSQESFHFLNYETQYLEIRFDGGRRDEQLAIAADSTTSPSVTLDEALSRLKAGNERFAQSKVSTGKPVAARQSSRSADHREVGPETDEA